MEQVKRVRQTNPKRKARNDYLVVGDTVYTQPHTTSPDDALAKITGSLTAKRVLTRTHGFKDAVLL